MTRTCQCQQTRDTKYPERCLSTTTITIDSITRRPQERILESSMCLNITAAHLCKRLEGQTYQLTLLRAPRTLHQTALTDVEIIEVSTPHFNDRVRVEEKFGLDPKQYHGLPTTEENEIIVK